MLLTFPFGGIHPPENKLSVGQKIQPAALPSQVAILLSQHIGAPAVPVVKKGDKVKVGTLIASASGFVSAPVHSSVSGTVAKIDTAYDASGFKKPAIIIDVKEDDWEDGIDTSADLISSITLTKEQIIEKIAQGGIVGLGGATFPAHVKLTPPAGKKADCLIINAVECEPYLTADHALMMEKPDEIMVGVSILMQALGVDKAIIAIENNKPDAISLLQQKALAFKGIHVQGMKTKYPQGGEKQLINALIRKEVPAGGLPIDVGVVVQNLATTFAVYEAVQKNKPLVERVVTVTGKSVTHPANLLVRIGTPIQNLIDAVGGLPQDTGKVISGGPMMGKAIDKLDAPSSKGTSGILILQQQESQRPEIQNCIRCGKCVSVCSLGVEPYLVATLSKNGMFEEAEAERIMDCCECGSCLYICPSARPLVDYIRLGKNKVGAIMRARAAKK